MQQPLFKNWWFFVVVAVINHSTLAFSEDPVTVLVNGPLSGTVGEKVSFEVELVNRSGQALQQLRVVDYFDEGFRHEVSKSPIEQQGAIELAAGTSRRLTLEFFLNQAGRHCHRVEIINQEKKFMGGATACVEVKTATTTATPPSTESASATNGDSTRLENSSAPNSSVPPTANPLPFATAPPSVPSPAAATSSPAMDSSPPTTATQPEASTQPNGSALTSPPPSSVDTTTLTTPNGTASDIPSFELELTGPDNILSGNKAEFSANIKNTGNVATGESTLDLSWDDSFSPLEASDGYVLGPSKVSWDLPSIQPGDRLRRQLNLQGQAPLNNYVDSPPSRSCVRAVLSGASGGIMVADEFCAPIHSTTPRPQSPQESGLRVSLADLCDPVVSDGITTLVCTISNVGTVPANNLSLVVNIPDQARLAGDPRPSSVRIDGSSITFDSIENIAPGEHATFEFSYRMPTEGIAEATAVVTSAELDGDAKASCSTTFLMPSP